MLLLIASVMPLLGSYVWWIYVVKGVGGVVADDDFGGIVVVNLDALQASGVGVGEVGDFVVEGRHVLAVSSNTAVAYLVGKSAIGGVPKCPRSLHFSKNKRSVVDYQSGFVGFSANYRLLYKGFKLCKAGLQDFVEGVNVGIEVVDDFGIDGLLCPKDCPSTEKGFGVDGVLWNKW